MNAYVDASVILRLILNEPGPRVSLPQFARAAASDLVRVECMRTIDRHRLAGLMAPEAFELAKVRLVGYLDTITPVLISRGTLELAARTLPVPLGALDAIHLATALLWKADIKESVTMATHDGGLAKAARAMGLPVIGVPEP